MTYVTFCQLTVIQDEAELLCWHLELVVSYVAPPLCPQRDVLLGPDKIVKVVKCKILVVDARCPSLYPARLPNAARNFARN
jgi:hypothetical protein